MSALLRVAPLLASIIAAAGLGCAAQSRDSAPLRLTTTAAGADTRVTLHAAPGVKVNARLAPALELSDGNVLRFDTPTRTADSAYFAEPPSAVLPGRHDSVHGTLRASICQDDERACRSVMLEL